MFSHLNELNRNLQGVNANMLVLRDKVASFIAKLNLWKTKMQSGYRVAEFPMMNKMIETNGVNSIIQSKVVDHFSRLIEEFHRYFPGFEQDTLLMALTRNPFRVSIENIPSEEDEDIQGKFLDMIHESFFEASFEDETLGKFWGMMGKAYPKTCAKTTNIVNYVPFYLSL